MQWDGSSNAGFTTGRPWIKVNKDFMELNVQQCLLHGNSILNTYKALLKLRNTEKTLQYGSYEKLERQGDIIRFSRIYKGDEIAVILNFGNEMKYHLPARAKILMGNTTLKSNEFLIYRK